MDIDDERPLGDEAAADLMRREEIDVVLNLGWAKDLQVGQNIVFSLKEALFKCQYTVTGRADIDFHEVELMPDSRGACARAQYTQPRSAVGRAVAQMQLFFEQIQGVRLAQAIISARHLNV